MNESDWLLLCEKTADKVCEEVASLKGKAIRNNIVRNYTARSPSFQLDLAAESAAVSILKETLTPIVLISEEAGTKVLGEHPQALVILDPVDGSLNAVRDIPFFSVSIAICELADLFSIDKVRVALVKNLHSGDTYTAVRGQCALLNGHPMRPSQIYELEKSVILANSRRAPKKMLPIYDSVMGVRCLGCTSLEICNVASGSYEGFIDIRNILGTYDVAAASFILAQAGGTVTDPMNETLNVKPTDAAISLIASANKRVHLEIMKILKSSRV